VTDEMLDLDGLPEPNRKVKAKEVTKAVTWARYKVTAKTVHCDTCLQKVHENWPHGTHAPNLAVFKRTEKGAVTFWCWEHGTDQRAKDGVDDPKKKKRK
jgi:2-polyprenyl-6-methoxyphenol hydroxylase-like FAD-dependent oxidoreductase